MARYYENPILLLRLAGVCRNSYKGAMTDSTRETLIPYECEGSFYRAFVGAVLDDNSRALSRVLRHCDPSIFTNVELVGRVKED